MASSTPSIGPGFGRLWSASTAGNLGDGIGRVAIALLAARLTRDPLAVAAVTALSYLPWLMFGLVAGVLVDRYDRRRLAVMAGGLRAAAVTVLSVAAVTGHASLWLLYAVVVLLYTCETVYDNSVLSMVPMVVTDPEQLERANGRLQGARLLAGSFVGPPLAGLVFALAAAAAFGVTTACHVTAALLLLTLRGSYRARTGDSDQPSRPASLGQEMLEGLRHVRGHAMHRRLLGAMVVLAAGGAMVNATMVLWVQDVLGVSEALYGAYGLTIACGALAGSQAAAGLATRLGRGRALRSGLLVCVVGAFVAASTTSPYVAGVGMVMVGFGTLVFNVVNVSLRQRITPGKLLGRVVGVYMTAAVGVMVLGSLAGGAIATVGGLRLPWLICGVTSLLATAWLMRGLRNEVVDRVVAEADNAAQSAPVTYPRRSWLDPRVTVRPSPIEGSGLFATEPIRAGETVAVVGGEPIDDQRLAQIDASGQPYDSIAVAAGVHLLLDSAHPIRYGNHSCTPNLWLADATTLVARRDIAAGDELTQDYAVYTGVESWTMPCHCDTDGCRRVVTGRDWRLPQLRQAYGDRWSPALLVRIRQLEGTQDE
jgi:MFS family permease